MSLIISSFTVSAPLLLLVSIGVVLNKLNFIDQKTIKAISKLVLKVLLPINMFLNIYEGDLKSSLNIKHLIVLFGGFTLCILINLIILLKSKIGVKQQTAILQNAIRPNLTMFAIPLSIEIAGESIRSLSSISAGLGTPLLNAYSIAEFEWFKQGPANKLKILKRIITSPLVIASIIGFGLNIISLPIPYIFKRTLQYCSNCVTPMSLMMVGASFNFYIDKSEIKKISYSVIYKTLICPIIGLLLGLLFKLNSDQLVVILCCFASPAAASCYATANDYDTDMNLINSTLVYSYVACILTLPLIISITKALSIIN